MLPTVFLDGVPADQIGAVDELSFSRTFAGGQGGGLRDLKLTLDLDGYDHHPSLRLHAPVDLRHGAESLGEGRIVSIDRDTWEIVVDGIVRLGEDYECRGADSEPASLAVGLPLAIGRGLPWVIPDGLTLPDGVPESMQTVTEALNAHCEQAGKVWLLDGRTLRIVDPPTSPTLILTATDNPNSSTDGLVTSVTAKYAGAVDEQGRPALISYVTVAAEDAPKHVERTIDLTSEGALTEEDAADRARAQLVAGTTATLTESVAVAEGALTMHDGKDLSEVLCTVREGQMVRQLDWINPDGSPGLFRDWIIGGVDWSLDDGLVLTPLGAEASTLAGAIIDIRRGIADAQGAADDAQGAADDAATLAYDPLADLITDDSNTFSGSTMPSSAAVGDIWLNSPNAYICTTAYSSGGTMANWAQVTNATTLALIRLHVLAFLAAEGAAGDALAAVAAANGKNVITGANRAPTSGDSGIEGDTWYYFVGGNISAVYVHTGTGWTQRKIRDEVIDTLSVGKISGITAEFLAARIDYLTSVTITGSTFQTAISGKRVVIDADNMVKFYDASGVQRGTIEGDTGLIRFAGGKVLFSGDVDVQGALGLSGWLTLGPGISGDVDISGNLSAAGQVSLPGFAKSGSVTLSMPNEDTNYTQTVVFSPAFPVGVVPTVMLTLRDVTGGTPRVKLSTSGISRSSFLINAARTAGSSSMVIDWLAIAT